MNTILRGEEPEDASKRSQVRSIYVMHGERTNGKEEKDIGAATAEKCDFKTAERSFRFRSFLFWTLMQLFQL